MKPIITDLVKADISGSFKYSDSGRQIYKDLGRPGLFLYAYKNKLTWTVCFTLENGVKFSKALGHFPTFSIERVLEYWKALSAAKKSRPVFSHLSRVFYELRKAEGPPDIITGRQRVITLKPGIKVEVVSGTLPAHERLNRIKSIFLAISNRALATDGPVPSEHKLITKEEYDAIWKYASGE